MARRMPEPLPIDDRPAAEAYAPGDPLPGPDPTRLRDQARELHERATELASAAGELRDAAAALRQDVATLVERAP
jgi:hypothetical protein